MVAAPPSTDGWYDIGTGGYLWVRSRMQVNLGAAGVASPAPRQIWEASPTRDGVKHGPVFTLSRRGPGASWIYLGVGWRRHNASAVSLSEGLRRVPCRVGVASPSFGVLRGAANAK